MSVSLMAPRPWLSTTLVDGKFHLWSHEQALQITNDTSPNSFPSIISFVGHTAKSVQLAGLLGYVKPFARHGQVRVLETCRHSSTHPLIYLDCELAVGSSARFYPSEEKCVRYTIDPTVDFQDRLVANIITPLSSVICYFATDFNGLKGIGSMLARQALLQQCHDTPTAVLPHVLVVTSTKSKEYDSTTSQSQLREMVIKEMVVFNPKLSVRAAERAVDNKFRGIHIMGLRKGHTSQTPNLGQRLADLCQESYWSRRMNGFLFNMRHTAAFADRIVHVFCSSKTTFSFLRQSRCKGFDCSQLETHLSEILSLISDATWLWSVVIPLVASAYCLASYPDGSHSTLMHDIDGR